MNRRQEIALQILCAILSSERGGNDGPMMVEVSVMMADALIEATEKPTAEEGAPRK